MSFLVRRQIGDTIILLDIDLGRWLAASGTSFPTTSAQLPLPHDGAVFFRSDLDAHYVWVEATHTWVLVGGSAGAPVAAEYITAAAHADLSAERVLTDTATVTWDFGTAGQAKATAVAAAAPDSDARFLALGWF